MHTLQSCKIKQTFLLLEPPGDKYFSALESSGTKDSSTLESSGVNSDAFTEEAKSFQIEFNISLDTLVADDGRKRVLFLRESTPFKTILVTINSTQTRLSFDLSINVSMP